MIMFLGFALDTTKEKAKNLENAITLTKNAEKYIVVESKPNATQT